VHQPSSLSDRDIFASNFDPLSHPEPEGIAHRRLRVYVAGPISKGDVFENVTNGIRWGKRMVKDGLAPYVPHFDAYMLAHTDDTVSWNAYLEWDLEWVAQAEAVFRLPGPSKGAALECARAVDMGIPIFFEDDPAMGYRALLLMADARGLRGERR
jgi:hypothetical protein